jgi:formiminoglutamase
MQIQQTDDPFWPRASAWLAGAHAEKPMARLAVLGAPLRLGSITPGRCDLAPAAVRAILRKFSCYDVELDADLRLIDARDLGDLPLADLKLEEAFEPLRDAVRNAAAGADALVLIGGDNGVTRPGVHGVADSRAGRLATGSAPGLAAGLAPRLDRCGLITLDAHFDLRDLSNGLSNGNPVRALLADGLPGENIAQIGIQPFANSQAYAEVAVEAGITVVTISQIRAHGVERLLTETLEHLSERVDHIYVDLDIDALDRIFAPATPGSRPGGLTPYEMRRVAWLCGAHPKVRAIDLVEVDPAQDIADATVMATASCLLSFASGLLSRS